MFICPLCHQTLVLPHQVHTCSNKLLNNFLLGKSPHSVELFWYFIQAYQQVGTVSIGPTKSMVGIASTKSIAWVIKLGKDFIDIVFPFAEAYKDNLCFHKIAQVPGQQQFNHHFRMCSKDDINDEVRNFMELALYKSNAN